MLAQSSKARGETSDQAVPNGSSSERSGRESIAEDEIGYAWQFIAMRVVCFHLHSRYILQFMTLPQVLSAANQ